MHCLFSGTVHPEKQTDEIAAGVTEKIMKYYNCEYDRTCGEYLLAVVGYHRRDDKTYRRHRDAWEYILCLFAEFGYQPVYQYPNPTLF